MSTKKKIPDKPAYNGKVYNFCGQKKLILAVCVILFAALIVGVIIRGDKKSLFGRTMRLMAACAEAGLWNVSFAVYQEDPGDNK